MSIDFFHVSHPSYIHYQFSDLLNLDDVSDFSAIPGTFGFAPIFSGTTSRISSFLSSQEIPKLSKPPKVSNHQFTRWQLKYFGKFSPWKCCYFSWVGGSTTKLRQLMRMRSSSPVMVQQVRGKFVTETSLEMGGFESMNEIRMVKLCVGCVHIL